MRCLCRDVDTFSHKVSQAVNLALGAAFQYTGPLKDCFKCGQSGHFAQQCPMRSPPTIVPQPSVGSAAQPAQPSTLCPPCKRGKYWANTCRSKTDISGNPLPPLQGNCLRGQPWVPQSIPFLLATGNSRQPDQPGVSTELPQAAQGWTCVPPPTQY